MRKIEPEKLRLGVSACLLGERVRYDGGHKRDAFLTDTLGRFVTWVPVCPEVETGLGIPRPTLSLVGDETAPRLVVEQTGEDLTRRMRRFAQERVEALAGLGLDGYVLKRGSPSCGLFSVPVHGHDDEPPAAGRGLYADVLVSRLPRLPVEEDGRLAEPAVREHFVERVVAAARWRAFVASRPRSRDLVGFHAAQKLAVLAHSPRHYAALGRVVAGIGARVTRAALDAYGALLMDALAVPATRGRHANVLEHLVGFFKRRLDADDRVDLSRAIAAYRRGAVPLAVPLTSIRDHARRLGVDYVARQAYLNPHPIVAAVDTHGTRHR